MNEPTRGRIGGSVRRRAPPTRRVRDDDSYNATLWDLNPRPLVLRKSFSHVSTSDGCAAAAAALSVVHIIFSAQSAPSARMLAAENEDTPAFARRYQALLSQAARNNERSVSSCSRSSVSVAGVAAGTTGRSCCSPRKKSHESFLRRNQCLDDIFMSIPIGKKRAVRIFPRGGSSKSILDTEITESFRTSTKKATSQPLDKQQ